MKTHWICFSVIGSLFLVLGAAAFFFIDQNSNNITGYLDHQSEAVYPGESSLFTRVESASDYRLTYCWKDFEQEERELSFSVQKSVLKEAEDEFGFFSADLELFVGESIESLQTEMIADLKKIAQNLIQKSRYSQYLSIADIDRKSFDLKITAPPLEYDAVKDEFRRLTRAIFKEQAKYDKKIEKAALKYKEIFLEEKGLRLQNSKIGINYSQLAQKNRTRIEGVFAGLSRLSPDLNLHQFVSLILSFVQGIQYGNPPAPENGKIILGFWVPPKVLVANFGDCDCKGVTFASLWLSYKKYPLLLIKIPDHMFIGLAIPSFSGEGVDINGLRYTLCEVTGPDKIPLGIISPYSRMYFEGGSFTYEIIK